MAVKRGLQPSPQDNAVSVYLGSVLDALGLPHSEAKGPAIGVFRFRARAARAQGLGIVRDPITDAAVPSACDAAHALITGTPTTSKRSRVPARAILEGDDVEWVVPPPA